MMHLTLPIVLATALVPSIAIGQVQFDNVNVGVNLSVGDDTVTDVTLGFAFVFPDGTSTTDITIDSNGRVFPMGADTSDFSPTVPEFLGATTSVTPYFEDLSPQEFGDVFFYTDATRANISWIDTVLFDDTAPFTFQVQLFADGRVGMVYDNRSFGIPITGLSDGSAVDPGLSDLSMDAASISNAATVYEDFLISTFDLDGVGIEFTPDGMGGWLLATGPAGSAPLPLALAVVTDSGSPTNRAFNYTPDMSGGYSITRAIGTFVDDSSLALDLNSLATGMGDDENYTVTLGFPFTFPGGQTVTDIVIDTNGRILADGTDGSDFSPSVIEALIGAPGAIVPWWCDMSPQNGTFLFFTDANQARITMLSAPQFNESNEISWQCTLRNDNSFKINYIDTDTWVTGFGSTSDDVIAGCFSGTDGTGADPGEGDHAAFLNGTNSEGTFYEFFDASLDEDPAVQPVLDAIGTPALGGSIAVRMTGVSDNGILGTMFFGFVNPGDLPLDIIGIEGGTLSSSADVTFGIPIVGEDAVFSVTLMNDPNLVGILGLDLQGVYVAFGDTTLGAVLTNGVHAQF